MTLEQRFWAKVDKRGPGECWPWKASKRTGGYGAFCDGNQGRVVQAHRFAYELCIGPIPSGTLVCHHCDIPGCVNPDHLFLGTQADNMQDAVAKGRIATGDRNGTHTHPERRATGARNGTRTHPESPPRGVAHDWAKLDDNKVREIRAAYKGGDVSQHALGLRYGVSRGSIQAIVNRRSWKHIA